MKIIFTLLNCLLAFSIFGQLDTMIVYDLATKTYQIVPPVSFDAAIAADKTNSSPGTLDGFTALTNEVPTENLFPGTDFTRLAKTAELFDMSHYPMRTSVKLEGISKSGSNFTCSGTLVSENMVMTAGHCTFDYFGEIEFYVESLEVLPSLNNGELPAGFEGAQVSKIFMSKNYFEGFGFFDVCLLLLEEPIGATLGYQGFGYAPVDELVDKIYHKFSYPGRNSETIPVEFYNGDTSRYNYGLMDYDPIFGYLELDAPSVLAIPGMSGSGLFEFIDEAPTIYGVLSFSNYSHIRIPPNQFYQLKNIIENYGVLSSTAFAEKELSVKIYPNPLDDFTTVRLPADLTGIANYKLTDFLGRVVREGEIRNHQLTLHRDNLASGNYVFTLLTERGDVLSRQIVVR